MQTKGKILKDYREIGSLFEELNVKKPMLVCGKSFQKTEIFRYLKGFDIVVFDHIRPNPRFDDMVDASIIFKEQSCDFIIGAGGGSPMDSAKMIRLMSTNDVEKCLSEPMQDNDIKSLFIPTTAGTGSEATKTSVFYVNEVDKLSIGNPVFIPDYVILDETLLETVPDYQRKCTCLDALCHAIESYCSVKSNDESKGYASEAIRLFLDHKDGYMKNEKEHNRGMLMASYYGGKAINITGTIAAHALCYNLTMNCGISHGHSVAAGLSKLWEYMLAHNDKINDPRGRDYVFATLDEVGVLMGGKDAFEGLKIFNDLIMDFDLKYPSFDTDMIESFVSKVNVSKLDRNPTNLDAIDVENIYKMIQGGI